jgi:lactate permease
MPWQMNIDPMKTLFGVDPGWSIFLSALVASIPILFLFWALAIKRMKGHWSAVGATGLAVIIAIIVYKMPVYLALSSTTLGILFGLAPICWVVLTALFVYNMSVETGQFEVIKNSLASISDDRRMQALLIAFSFGAFIEGAAGFGTPVAITAAMLAGLGFNPIYAAGICLLANTAPVAYGSIGTPVVVGAQIAGVDEMAMSAMVGRTLPFLSVIVPLYLCILMAGWKKGMEVWPACFVCGVSFAIAQFFVSNYIGPQLTDILAALASIVCIVIFLKVWHPKESWHFADEPKSLGKAELKYTIGQVFRAWAPFIILSICVGAWGAKPIKQALDQMFTMLLQTVGFAGQSFPVAGLHNMVIDQAMKPKAAAFNFNFLSMAGTSILFAFFFSIPAMGASVGQAFKSAGHTLKTLRWPIFTIACILGFAYIMNYSGMAITLGYAFASSGAAFPFFAAVLGWLGVFMTGSDTSSNALFGKLQAVTAEKIGIDPIITVSANSSGGVLGKMISPQSISVATGATGLVGRESDIFRFTLKHSIALTIVVGIMAMLQAYVFTWIVPKVAAATAPAAGAAPAVAVPIIVPPAINPEGLMWLGIAFAGIILTIVIARMFGKDLEGAGGAKSETHFH